MPSSTLALSSFRYRTPFMLGMMALGIALLIHDSRTHLGWVSAARWSYGLFAGYALYAALARDGLVARLLGFALVAGLAEPGVRCLPGGRDQHPALPRARSHALAFAAVHAL
ncbi:hypothetical protein ACFQT0_09070 [Hymenobacter humi]|uniref:Uncharacterized protein n=1 Tax=Hymenobacter humi TaxID=1411620 RepID=A0ABW2U231_9BACT